MVFVRITRLVLILISLMVLSIIGCGLKKPQAPRWYTDLTIPLLDKIIYVPTIIEHASGPNVSFDSTGSPFLNIAREMEPIQFAEYLRLQNSFFHLKDSIGIIQLSEHETAYLSIPITRLFQPLNRIIVASRFSFQFTMPSWDTFDWLQVTEGGLDFSLNNSLGIDLDTLSISLIDSIDSHVIGTVIFENGLRNGEAEWRQLDINGQRISSKIILRINGHTPGGQIEDDDSQFLAINLSFGDQLLVSEGRAKIPGLLITREDLHNINDSAFIQTASILEGTLQFEINNFTEMPCSVNIYSPNLILSGNTFAKAEYLPPWAGSDLVVDISGYLLVPDEDTTPQNIVFGMISRVISSGSGKYDFSATDSFNLELEMIDIKFQSFIGNIAEPAFPMDPLIISTDLPDQADQSRMIDPNFEILIANNSQVPLLFSFTIANDVTSFSLEGIAEPKNGPYAFPETTIFSPSPPQLEVLFEFIPDQIGISGNCLLNPDMEIVPFSRDDYLTGQVSIGSTLIFSLSDTVIFENHITTVEITDPENYLNLMNEGTIKAVLENHLPLNASVFLFLGTSSDSNMYRDQSSIVMGPYFINPAIIDSNGAAIEPTILMVSETIDNSHRSLLDNDSLFIGQKIKIFPRDSSDVRLNASDYFRIRANVNTGIEIGG